ncbi:MAG: GGDEF domain-containing protein [Bacillota bacterium]|nr:GGDEF domain-containing protein [Bacillota bacterium]
MRNKNKRMTFALLVDWFTGWGDIDCYEWGIHAGVAGFSKENDINLMTFVTGRLDSPRGWEKNRNILFEFLDSNKVDGIIVIPPCINIYGVSTNNSSVLEKYKDIPLVVIGEDMKNHSSVYVNNYKIMKEMVEHLIDVHHCKKIAYMKGLEGSKEMEWRYQAYIDVLDERNMPFDPELLYYGDYTFASGSHGMSQFIRKNIKFDGLVCSNDEMAVGAMIEYYRVYGKPVENICITGFDDSERSQIHGLTTVRQSFYDEGRTAAEVLYRLICGEKGPIKEELPASLIIRSSCGCISEIEANAIKADTFFNNKSFESSFKENRRSILDSILEINNKYGFYKEGHGKEQLINYEEKLIDAFYREYHEGKKNEFLMSWNRIVSWVMLRKENMLFLQELLSHLRRTLLSCLSKEDNIVEAENLIHVAGIHFHDMSIKNKGGINYVNEYQTVDLEPLEEELASSIDLEGQMELLYGNLPKLGIDSAYVSIYEDDKRPLEQSTLMLAYTRGRRHDVGNRGLSYSTLKLLPEQIWDELQQERFNLIIQALYHDNQLGFVILNIDFKPHQIPERIRSRLSSAVRAALMVKSIKGQAEELELQVIERTRELSQTNQQLVQEVERRREAEEQLKEALMELKRYNKTLHLQSVRDELTGLYNRRGFITLGSEQFGRSEKLGQGCLVFYADLDGLKQINDMFGHAEGDNALIKAAEILTQSFRATDIIARLGGDEFTVLVVGADPEDKELMWNRVKYYCDEYNRTSNKPYKLSISIGCTYFKSDPEVNLERLLRDADSDLYSEKHRKRQHNKIESK